MKIHALSDIHRQHIGLTRYLTGGDLLILSGDYDCINEESTSTFLNWVKKVSKNYKFGTILIGGNHDPELEENVDELLLNELKTHNIHYLNNESIKINNLIFFGTPNIETKAKFKREYCAFAKNIEQMKITCDNIPTNTDVLISHCPAWGILDNYIGSTELNKVIKKIRPKIHICGHIHESFGHFTQTHEIGEGEYILGKTEHFNVAIAGNTRKGPYLPTEIILDEEGNLVSFSQLEMDVT